MFTPYAPGGVAAVAYAVREVKTLWLLEELCALEAVATTTGVESPVKTVGGHENVPPEQSQLLMDAGVAVVRVIFTSRELGEQVPVNVTVSPEEKKPGSFRLTLALPELVSEPSGERPPFWPQEKTNKNPQIKISPRNLYALFGFIYMCRSSVFFL